MGDAALRRIEMRYSYIESPLGELLVTRDDDGLTGLCLPTGRYPQRVRDGWQRDDDAFDDVRRELDEYFAGTLQDFTVPLSPRGSTFQKQVWQALSEIPRRDDELREGRGVDRAPGRRARCGCGE